MRIVSESGVRARIAKAVTLIHNNRQRNSSNKSLILAALRPLITFLDSNDSNTGADFVATKCRACFRLLVLPSEQAPAFFGDHAFLPRRVINQLHVDFLDPL